MKRLLLHLSAVFAVLMPVTAHCHLVNSNVGEFYSGMLHPLTSLEHILPMTALALFASQVGKRAARMILWLFPLALSLGILVGSRFHFVDHFHFANLVALVVLGGLILSASRCAPVLPSLAAIATGTILGCRSGVDWAASGVGFQFIPGAALTGLLCMAVIAVWVPKAAGRRWALVRSVVGSLFILAGLALLGRFFLVEDIVVGGSIGMPTEENLKSLVAAPDLSFTFVISALFAAWLWGAAHALTPGHGKAIVGAYLIGARGTAWHALYLGLTVTVTHTLGVVLLGIIATLAASHVQPETLYPWLGVLSGLIILALGLYMLISRVRQNRSASLGHHHTYGHSHSHSHAHTHDHQHDGKKARGHSHLHGHHHHHEGHSHLPPGADGAPVTYRSLLTLGISGGLLPCPSAMVLLLAAVALHRIGFGLALVVAFSLGLAGVLTAVGLLFIKGSRLIDSSPSYAVASRWLPAASAMVVALLGVAITWNAVAALAGG